LSRAGLDVPDEARMRSIATAMSGARAAVGAGALLAPRVTSRLMGFPKQHDNPTARMIGRCFAVRELALAGYTAAQVQRSAIQPDVYMLNAAVDMGDAVVCALTLFGHRGVARVAAGTLALAVPFAATFLWLRGSCQS
jgi:hypothetical protein